MQRRILWVACAIICLAPALSIAQPMSPAARSLDKRDKALLEQSHGLSQSPTRVIVRFKSDASEKDRANAHASIKATLLHRSGLVPGLEVLDSDLGASSAIAALRHNSKVQYAEFDAVIHADTIPNDHQFSLLWALNDSPGYNIHAPETWSIFTGDPNFVIADIDSGMQIDHPDLAANLYTNPKEIPGNGIDDDGDGLIDDVHGWDFYENDSVPQDDVGHGTHTAGTMGAVGNNAWGVAGVNWHCKLMPLKFLGPNGSGYASDAIRALEYAVNMGVKISNNSWGSTTYEQSLYDAIAAAKTSGHLFVAAAGNDSANNDVNPHYPASFTLDNIISVAAVDQMGNLATFSNYGKASVDIAAPGVGICSTVPGNNLQYYDGTSMACPHVTGVAALLWGYRPTMSWQDVKARILAKVQPSSNLAGQCTSGGLLDAYATLTDNPLPPIISFVTPSQASSYSQPEVLLIAKATDVQDGDISNRIIWRDSVLGQIAQGLVCYTGNLSAGAHTIIASVTDSRGIVGTNQTVVQVFSSGPIVSGLAQASSLSYPEGSLVTLNASAIDPSFGTLTSQIQWNSQLQGSLGQGGTLNRYDLKPGTHVITAIVSNSVSVFAGQPTQITIVAATAPPNAPTNPSFAMYNSGMAMYMKVAWSDTSNNEVGFDIEASYKGSGKTWTVWPTLFTAATNQTSTLIQPPGAYTWRFRVRSRNSAGASAWSSYSNSLKVS